jgi:hypothetical protein
MSQRNPDLSSAVYVALVSGLVLVCLMGALALPSGVYTNKGFGVAVFVGLLVGIPVLDRLAHRSRIRDAVEQLGGIVVRIKRLSFWRRLDEASFQRHLPFARQIEHQVEFRDMMGRLHHASCLSGWFHGVTWLNDMISD